MLCNKWRGVILVTVMYDACCIVEVYFNVISHCGTVIDIVVIVQKWTLMLRITCICHHVVLTLNPATIKEFQA
jgi:hypothetical protein